jgi:ABC-type glycerol-3-phosphate transport system substrate-binding protein
MQQECRRTIRGLLVGFVLAMGAGGCNGNRPSAVRPPPRWAGVTVRVAAPDGRPRRLVDRLGQAWANETGATLSVAVPTGDWPAADVVLIPAPDLPRWAAAGKAAPLPQPEMLDAFTPLYRTRLLSWAGTPFALPVLGDGPVCVYRIDLYADPASQQAYVEKHRRPLKPPETWDEFADQAEFFAARRARPSLPPMPTDDAGVCAAFEAIAAPSSVPAVVTTAERPGQGRSARPFSVQYDVDSGDPRLAGPGFIEALALLKRMNPHRATSPTAAEAMRSDQMALGYVTLAEFGGLKPGEARRWGVFRTPGSRRVFGPDGPAGPVDSLNVVPFVGAGAVVGVVPVGAAQVEAAFDLLGYLSGPTASVEAVHTPSLGSGPFRDIHLDPQRELGWLNYDLDERQTALLRTYLREVADPRVDNPALALRIPDRTRHVAALAAAVRLAVTGADPAGVLKTAADEWRKLDGDPAKARAEYRRSVGLQP